MAVLDFVVYFFLLIMVVIAVGIGVFLSMSITNNSRYSFDQNLVTLNWILIAAYVLLIIVAILIFVNLIASVFFYTPAVTNLTYRFPFWLAVVSLILLFIAFVLYGWVYFQFMSVGLIVDPFIPIANVQGSSLVLGAVILSFLSFLVLLFYTIYIAYYPSIIEIPSTTILPPPTPMVVEEEGTLFEHAGSEVATSESFLPSGTTSSPALTTNVGAPAYVPTYSVRRQ